MQEPETQYARGKDGHVAYQVMGDGPFDVVLIPNWLTCVEAMWEEPMLADPFFFRGCGRSEFARRDENLRASVRL